MLEVRLRFKRRGNSPVAFDLDVDFQAGAGITILFGSSGAGKSTLLDCIAGLLEPQFAHIVVNPLVLQDSTTGVFLPPKKRCLAYLFQSPALFPHLTVQENTAFGLQELNQ